MSTQSKSTSPRRTRKSKSVSPVTTNSNVIKIDPKRRKELHNLRWKQALVNFLAPLSVQDFNLIEAHDNLMHLGFVGRLKPKLSKVIPFPVVNKRLAVKEAQ